MFLMHRVELKDLHLQMEQARTDKFLMHRVELKATNHQNMAT